MDVVEFRRLMDRIVATRNAESRSFLLAFDLAPAVMRGSAAQTSVKWDTWSRHREALQAAVTDLQRFLSADVVREAGAFSSGGAATSQRVPAAPRNGNR